MPIETLRAALRQINRLFAAGAVTGFSDARLLERFVSGHDPAAFEALVGRHGPMVLSVCRGILRDPNDAEDAFQATFLILVKKSGTFRGQVALGPWLYQVAHRVALRANAAAARRRARERQAGKMAAASLTPMPALPDEELQALHEEIARLPVKLRRAVILCDLERVPQARAAGELRLSERTLQRRLSEGRERLKARLIRRGLAPDGGMLAAVFLREARLAVPPAWGEMTVRAALSTVNPSLTVGVVSAGAKQLTREVLRLMLLQKLTLASAPLLAAGLIAWGASAALVSLPEEPTRKLAAGPNPTPQRQAKTAVPQPAPNALDTPGKVTVRGRVLAPDGRPVPGAKLYQTDSEGHFRSAYPSSESMTTGPDGRFLFTVAKGKWNEYSNQVAAAAPNLGVGWVVIPAGGKTDDLTLQLVDDGVPITGQIVNLQGKPVQGATLRVTQINAAPGEDLGPWLEAVRRENSAHQWIDGRYDRIENLYLPRTIAPTLEVTSDAEGRIRLTGIGRNRLVTAQLDGPTVVTEHLFILTRPGEPISVRTLQIGPASVTTYYGSSFRYVAAPTRPITGVVRDKGTKKPLAGFTIRSHSFEARPNEFAMVDIVQTTTDAEGRYHLIGMPKGKGYRIVAVPPTDQPYVPATRKVPDTPGLDAVTLDVELKRGVWIKGKITDKVTGQPIPGANVEYFTFYSNPNHSDYDGFSMSVHSHSVKPKDDGTYRVAGLPGPGLVAVHAPWETGYVRVTGRDDEEWADNKELNGTSPFAISHPDNYCEIARVDPPKGVDSVTRDVTLDPGWDFSGTVLGPDGKPFWGRGFVFVLNESHSWDYGAMKGAEFTVHCSNPRQPRELLLHHPETGLVGLAQTPQNKGDSITVQLQLGATVTGRLLDWRPRAEVELKLSFRGKERQVWHRYSTQVIKTDRDGRFRVTALLPGRKYRLSHGERGLNFGDGLRSGYTKDLGDVRLTAEKE